MKKCILISIIILSIIAIGTGIYVKNVLNKPQMPTDWMKVNDPDFLTYQAHIFKTIDYNQSSDGTGVRVAIIDSGINIDHEDLNPSKILKGYNYTSEDIDDIRDEAGHGTFIAGIIGAQSNNSVGMAGLTPNVEIVPIKCFDASLDSDIETIIQCIKKAIELEVDVMNLSFTIEEYSPELETAIEKATKENIIVVAPSGNDMSGKKYYPAAFSQVVSVNPIKVNPVGLAFNSSKVSNPNKEVVVAAPGERILSLSHIGTSGYEQSSGSSYATAIVSSVAIMVKQQDPTITSRQFIELLKSTSADYGKIGFDEIFGYGIVSVDNLMDALSASL